MNPITNFAGDKIKTYVIYFRSSQSNMTQAIRLQAGKMEQAIELFAQMYRGATLVAIKNKGN